MKTSKTILLSVWTILSILGLIGCDKEEVLPETQFACNFQQADEARNHPKADRYQNLLEKHRKDGLVGAVLLVKDRNGLWIGADGKADIASNINLGPCHSFFIGSISKVFTAAATYKYIEKGILNFDDPIKKWLPQDMVSKVKNAESAQIKHLLSHTSGIRDFYTIKFELDRENRTHNKWNKEDVIKYIYNKSADFPVGETYSYSNTNFLLLSIILEKASGKTFEEVYKEEVFTPLNLQSAYYSASKPIPDHAVTGHVEYTYASGQFHNAKNLYIDELGIGGDGGIAINAYDLSVFLESLMKGQLLTSSSLTQMTDWFDIPKDEQWEEFGQTENGYGLEKFNTQYGYAAGHTGSVDGFSSYGFYFPEQDMTYILLVNGTNGDSDAHEDLFNNTLKIMFE